ncbi:hypothetical protein A0H81_10301 [Grifola frondosa]|uniref:Uncharacterized protein n=1 Tax=Grifola frondosa TaxID=5627 RepID=A0A1C7M3D5_GRIFR|nr:hypothetical protein A0H81_10301 [Grifola frondosa]
MDEDIQEPPVVPEPPLVVPAHQRRTEYHTHLSGDPCDIDGTFLAPDTPPAPSPQRPPHDFTPYTNRAQFELADFFFRKDQMAGTKIDELMQLWAAWAAMLPPNSGQKPPFADHTDLYGSIDSIELGEIAWQTFSVTYKGPRPDGEAPPWMDTEYDIWYRCPRQVLRNQLANPDFAGEMDFSAKRVFSNENKREYQDFMSGNWAWDQSVS